MPYIQNSAQDQREMLERIGLDSLDQLFAPLPAAMKLDRPLDIDPGRTELELKQHLAEMASWNHPAAERPCFLGGGTYDHDWPALIDSLMGRTEFLTAYTPYQPECSQGTLQWIYEFQSMIAEICGCEIANASMYDGASAAAEAALMAIAIKRRHKVVVSAGLHPHARATLHTYLQHHGTELVEAPLVDGVTQWGDLVDGRTAAVLVQQPNYLGLIEDLDQVQSTAADHGALSVCSLYPVATGLLRSPGHAGIDVVVGDGQSLGVPMGFGGPHFGFFATRQEFVRKLPGRLVGESLDRDGRRAYTLTFATREQHIRREKATSNICTNNALIALRGCIHMAALGPQGLEEVACVSRQRALELAEVLPASNGNLQLAFPQQAFFNEVPFRAAGGEAAVRRLQQALAHGGISGVLPMAPDYPGLEGVFTLACTEKTSSSDIQALARIAAECFRTEAAL